MGMRIHRPGEAQAKRRATELTAFDGKELSKIAFTVGGWGNLMPGMRRMCFCFMLFCGWQLIRHWFFYREPDHAHYRMTMWLWILVMLLLIAVMFMISIYERLHPKVNVRGDTLEFRGAQYQCRMLWEIRVTRSERIIIYTAGKPLASYRWDEENVELLLAWAHKCGVQISDQRSGTDVF